MAMILAGVGIVLLVLCPNPSDLFTRNVWDEAIRKNGIIF
jgi:hypothetical protein